MLVLTLIVGVRLAVSGRGLLIPSNGPARFCGQLLLLGQLVLRHENRAYRLKLESAASSH